MIYFADLKKKEIKFFCLFNLESYADSFWFNLIQSLVSSLITHASQKNLTLSQKILKNQYSHYSLRHPSLRTVRYRNCTFINSLIISTSK